MCIGQVRKLFLMCVEKFSERKKGRSSINRKHTHINTHTHTHTLEISFENETFSQYDNKQSQKGLLTLIT